MWNSWNHIYWFDVLGAIFFEVIEKFLSNSLLKSSRKNDQFWNLNNYKLTKFINIFAFNYKEHINDFFQAFKAF
jgi:hypothetical protein